MNVLLLHALPLDHRMWEPQLPALRAHDVVAPDLYGLGRSMEEWARRALALVDGELVVVGASMGGYCALQAARLAPERVRGVVLAGSRPEADAPERRPVREEWIRLVREGGAPALWEAMRERVYATAAPDVQARAEAIALEQPDEGLVAAVEAIRDRPDGRDVVAALEAPFLLVVGDSDPLVPASEAADIVVAARNGRLVVFDGVGHVPSLERPQEFNAVLADFLEEV
jgi:pimeloyl-ACP methyl ester carboxylesterase